MDQVWQQLLAYMKAAWHRRWWGVATAWLVCVVGWTAVFLTPSRYEASARVYVDTQTLLKPLLQGLTIGDANVDQQIRLMTRQLFSRPTLEKVARMTDLDVKAKTPEQTEAMLNGLAGKISIADAGRENLYTISYQDANGDLALPVMDYTSELPADIVAEAEFEKLGFKREGLLRQVNHARANEQSTQRPAHFISQLAAFAQQLEADGVKLATLLFGVDQHTSLLHLSTLSAARLCRAL
mgnify:CR=1 FL=1